MLAHNNNLATRLRLFNTINNPVIPLHKLSHKARMLKHLQFNTISNLVIPLLQLQVFKNSSINLFFFAPQAPLPSPPSVTSAPSIAPEHPASSGGYDVPRTSSNVQSTHYENKPSSEYRRRA